MPPVALVTGGNRGIGLGISRRLVEDGFAVSILATREEPADVLAELRALAGDDAAVRYVRGSVADPDDHARYLDDAVDAWGRLDVLVNNAGVAPTVRADLLEASAESFDSEWLDQSPQSDDLPYVNSGSGHAANRDPRAEGVRRQIRGIFLVGLPVAILACQLIGVLLWWAIS